MSLATFQSAAAATFTEFREGADLPRTQTPGLYLLYQDDQLVYIGQSSNIALRVHQHRAEGKKRFNSFKWYHEWDENARLLLETLLIVCYCPPANQALLLRIARGRLSEIRYKRKSRAG